MTTPNECEKHIVTQPCIECNGRGVSYDETCPTCGGNGLWHLCDNCNEYVEGYGVDQL